MLTQKAFFSKQKSRPAIRHVSQKRCRMYSSRCVWETTVEEDILFVWSCCWNRCFGRRTGWKDTVRRTVEAQLTNWTSRSRPPQCEWRANSWQYNAFKLSPEAGTLRQQTFLEDSCWCRSPKKASHYICSLGWLLKTDLFASEEALLYLTSNNKENLLSL